MVEEPAEEMDGEQGWDVVGFILLRAPPATGMILARRGQRSNTKILLVCTSGSAQL